MALTHNELYRVTTKTEGEGGKNSIVGACWKAAKEIFQELDTVPEHTARIVYARLLLADDGYGATMKQMVRMVVVVLDKVAPYTDAEITIAINQIITKIAVAS